MARAHVKGGHTFRKGVLLHSEGLESRISEPFPPQRSNLVRPSMIPSEKESSAPENPSKKARSCMRKHDALSVKCAPHHSKLVFEDILCSNICLRGVEFLACQ